MSINDHNGATQRMKLNRHPICWVKEVLNSYLNSSIKLNLSRYRYEPQSFKDERQEFSILASDLNESNLLIELINLAPDYELALHSKLYLNSVLMHLPMIDFGSKGAEPSASGVLKELCTYWGMGFNIFSSGRSYHAYGNKLLNHEQWLQFMGSLLLLNKPSGYKLIDERWVGHRIMGGYSALRWSKNTSHYKKFPTHCGFVSGTHFFVGEYFPPPPPPTISFN
ncbi:primase 1D-like protein [Pseudoalteromonas sp. 1181_04]|uniref:primase 1D-like protein n=1 Tax=Pseudoalteromonas sp. 1181_04 TaxID=2604450 RepID=UPI00406439B9